MKNCHGITFKMLDFGGGSRLLHACSLDRYLVHSCVQIILKYTWVMIVNPSFLNHENIYVISRISVLKTTKI